MPETIAVLPQDRDLFSKDTQTFRCVNISYAAGCARHVMTKQSGPAADLNTLQIITASTVVYTDLKIENFYGGNCICPQTTSELGAATDLEIYQL